MSRTEHLDILVSAIPAEFVEIDCYDRLIEHQFGAASELAWLKERSGTCEPCIIADISKLRAERDELREALEKTMTRCSDSSIWDFAAAVLAKYPEKES